MVDLDLDYAHVMAKRIVLAGGSGFIGQSLSRVLVENGYDVVVLSRSPAKAPERARGVLWDGKTLGAWTACLEGAEAVINLAGKNVNCRYTPKNLKEIDESRVNSVSAIGKAIRACVRPPTTLVQAATLAIYGDAGERVCDETAPPGDGIPVRTATAWENAFNETSLPSTRRVLLRISFALGRGGGALPTLAALARWLLGGRVSSGRQYISWVHIDDLNRMFLWALERQSMAGVYNATSPSPVTNAEFMRVLRRTLGRPWAPPTPAWAVHFGSFLLRTEPVLALTGRRGVPMRLIEEGFEFKYPRLEQALADLLA